MKARSKAVSMARAAAAIAIALVAVAVESRAENPGAFLVPTASSWRYLAGASSQGTAWRATLFVDGSWPQGNAELGYGDGDEATVVPCGPSAPTCNAGNFITSYFRKSFTVSDAGSIPQLELGIRRDDGAVANGTNVLAVEIRQSSATSSDIRLEASLQVTAPAPLALALVRAPYLQNVTPTSAVIRWRTTAATTTRVRWGLAADALTNTVDVAGVRSEHEVPLAGLTPETRIYYSVGSTSQTLAGGDANHFLEVPALAGQRRPTRIWVIGDAGLCAVSAQGCIDASAVRNGYIAYAGSNPADLWLMLGDNVYNSGTDTEFTNGEFNVYPTIMRNTPFWSVPGNHEFGTGGADSPTQTGPYYDSHTFPTGGEAGGVPSGTEAYYSFDWANIHFVLLDSHDTSRAAPANPTTNICPPGQGGAMYQWACADLAATDQDFVIALWHHPPYSKGSHNSDTDAQLIEMRERFLPVMEAYGVDLVLAGHSHSYERSVLLDGHYGLSSSYSPALHAVDAGDGNPTGDGAYVKSAIGPDPNTGTVAAVPGNASQISGGALNHPVMAKSLNILGSMVIDVVGRQLDARLIGVSGNVLDSFRIVKGPLLPVCSDGIDQDGDGQFDYPSDAGCASKLATLENPQCDDGIDNDGDTFVDFPADPGCASEASNRENPRCDDDLDNDADGAIDWDGGSLSGTPDPQCVTAYRNHEERSVSCGLGAELVIACALLESLEARRRRARRVRGRC